MHSKRLRITIAGLVVNFITVWVGIYHGVDLNALGVCLSLINAPLYVYVMGDTIRKS